MASPARGPPWRSSRASRWSTARSRTGSSGMSATSPAAVVSSRGIVLSRGHRWAMARLALSGSSRRKAATGSRARTKTVRSASGTSGLLAAAAAEQASVPACGACSSSRRTTAWAAASPSPRPRAARSSSAPTLRCWTASGPSGASGAPAVPSATAVRGAATGTSRSTPGTAESRARPTALRSSSLATRRPAPNRNAWTGSGIAGASGRPAPRPARAASPGGSGTSSWRRTPAASPPLAPPGRRLRAVRTRHARWTGTAPSTRGGSGASARGDAEAFRGVRGV
mmetsp:Transcript_25146/g.72093  ORF Transcript_25146/g.72093 Transcript_25146/m.72093 type:complete len:283 (+) Transcript_25146:382-1230(+)